MTSANPPPKLNEYQSQLSQDIIHSKSEDELSNILSNLKKEDWKQTPVREWTPVLNFLESLISHYITQHPNVFKIAKMPPHKPTDPKEEQKKKMVPPFSLKHDSLLQVLDFVAFLLRSSYLSWRVISSMNDRMADLLVDENAIVVLAALKVLLANEGVAFGMSSGILGTKPAMHHRLLTLALGYGEQSLNPILAPELSQTIVDNANNINIKIYNDTFRKQGKKAPKQEPSSSTTTATPPVTTNATIPNMYHIQIKDILNSNQSALDVYKQAAGGKFLHRNDQFDVWTIIRMTKSLLSHKERTLWTIIRLRALVALSNSSPHNHFMAEFFHFQPAFIKELKELLSDESVSEDARAHAISALRAIVSNADYKDVASATLMPVGSDAYHGFLSQLLRKIHSRVKEENAPEESLYLKEIFGLLSTLARINEKAFQESGMLSQIILLAKEVYQKKQWFIAEKCFKCLLTLCSHRAPNPILSYLSQSDSVESFVAMIHTFVQDVEEEFPVQTDTITTTTTNAGDTAPENSQLLRERISESRYSSFHCLLEIFSMLTKSPEVTVRTVLESTFLRDVKTVLNRQHLYGQQLVSSTLKPLISLMNAEPILIPMVKNLILEDLIRILKTDEQSEVTHSTSLLVTFALNKTSLEEIIKSNVLTVLIDRVINSKMRSRLLEAVGPSLGTFARHHTEVQDQIVDSILKSCEDLAEKCTPELMDNTPQLLMLRQVKPGDAASSKAPQMSAESKQLIRSVEALGSMITSFLGRQSTLSRIFVQKGGIPKLSKLALKCGTNKRVLMLMHQIFETLSHGPTAVDVLKAHANFIVDNFSDVQLDPETFFESPSQRAMVHAFLFSCRLLLSRRNTQLTNVVTATQRKDAYSVLQRAFPVIIQVFPKLHILSAHLRITLRKQQQLEKEAAAAEKAITGTTTSTFTPAPTSKKAESTATSSDEKEKAKEKKVTPQQLIFSSLNADFSHIRRLFDALQRFVFHSIVDESPRHIADAKSALELCDAVGIAVEQVFTSLSEQNDPLEVRCDAGAGIMDHLTSLLYSSLHSNTNAPLLASLKNKGALQKFSNYFEKTSLEILDNYKPKEKRNEKRPEDSFIVSSCFFVQKILNVEMLLHNPLTEVLKMKENFDADKLVEGIALIFAPAIAKVMHHPNVPKTDGLVAEMIINVVARLEKGATLSTTTAAPPVRSPFGLSATRLFGARPELPVNRAALAELLSMGFPQRRAETALRRFHNDLQMATEFLLHSVEEEGEEGDEEPNQQDNQEEEAPKEEATMGTAAEGDNANEQKEILQKIRSEAADWCLNLAQNSSEDISYACSDLLEVVGEQADATAPTVGQKLIGVLEKPTNTSQEVQQVTQSVLNIVSHSVHKRNLTREALVHNGQSAILILLGILQTHMEKEHTSDSVKHILRLLALLSEHRESSDKKLNTETSPGTQPSIFTDEEALKTIQLLVTLLDKCSVEPEKMSDSTLELVLSILVNLTKTFTVAQQALESGLADQLVALPFELPNSRFVTFVSSILRHIVEDSTLTRRSLELRVRAYVRDNATDTTSTDPRTARSSNTVPRLLQQFSDELNREPDLLMDIIQKECKIQDNKLVLKEPEKEIEAIQPSNSLKIVLEALVKLLLSYQTRTEKEKIGLQEQDILFILSKMVRLYNCSTIVSDFDSLTSQYGSFVKYIVRNILAHASLAPPNRRTISAEQRSRHSAARMASYFISVLMATQPVDILADLRDVLLNPATPLKVIGGIVGTFKTSLDSRDVSASKLLLALLQNEIVPAMMKAIDNADLDHPDAVDVVAQATSCLEKLVRSTNGAVKKEKLAQKITSLELPFTVFEREYTRDRDVKFNSFGYEEEEYFSEDESDEEEGEDVDQDEMLDEEDEEGQEEEGEQDDDDEDEQMIVDAEEMEAAMDMHMAEDEEDFTDEHAEDVIDESSYYEEEVDLMERLQQRLSDAEIGARPHFYVSSSRSRQEPQYERVAAPIARGPGLGSRLRRDYADEPIYEILGDYAAREGRSTRRNVEHYTRLLQDSLEGSSTTRAASRQVYNLFQDHFQGLRDDGHSLLDEDHLLGEVRRHLNRAANGEDDEDHDDLPDDDEGEHDDDDEEIMDESLDNQPVTTTTTTSSSPLPTTSSAENPSTTDTTLSTPQTTTNTEGETTPVTRPPPTSAEETTPEPQQLQESTSQEEEQLVQDEEEFSIDPTFLAALPNELRTEILAQHIASLVNPDAEVTENESTISQAFLNALPDDEIRGEVLRQEREYLAEQRRERLPQQADEQPPTDATLTTTSDNNAAPETTDAPATTTDNNISPEDETAAFIASLPPHLREEVLLTSEQSVIDNLPPDLAAEARQLRSRYMPVSMPPPRESTRPRERQNDTLRQARYQLRLFAKRHETLDNDDELILSDENIITLFKLLYSSKNKSRTHILTILTILCKRKRHAKVIIECIVNILSGNPNNSNNSPVLYRLFGEPPAAAFSLCRTTSNTIPNSVLQRLMDLTHHLLNDDKTLTIMAEQQVNADTEQVALLFLFELLGDESITSNSNVLLQLVTLLHSSMSYFARTLSAFKESINVYSKQVEELEKKTQKSAAEEKSIKKLNHKLTKLESGETELRNMTAAFITEQSIRLVGDVLTSSNCPVKAAKFAVRLINDMCLLNPDCRPEILQKLADLARSEGRDIATSLRATPNQEKSAQQYKEDMQRETRFCRLITTYTAILKAAVAELQAVQKVLAANDMDTTDIQTQMDAVHVLHDYQFDYVWEALQFFMRNTEIKPSSPDFARLIPLVEAFFSFQSIFMHEENEEEDMLVKRMDIQTPTTGTPVGRIEKFLEDNRDILNEVVRSNPHLLDESLSLFITKYPRFVDFDNKRTWFKKALAKDRERVGAHRGVLRMSVRREHIFVDAFFNVRQRVPEELKQRLNVHFQGEEGADAGGLTREFFLVLSREMFNPNYALFTSSADRLYQPNPYSYINSEHLEYFQFVARVIGMAVYNNQLLDCFFTRSFYKHILGKKITYHDIESVDPDLYKNLKWMLENDITDIIDTNFTARVDEFGKHKVIELKEDGENIPVTNENKHEYVKLRTELSMTTQIKKQLEAFLIAFYEIIPRRLISIFNPEELELLISGLPEFDVEDLKKNTDYYGYSPDDEVIEWFWRWVESLNQNDRALFLQFVTGTSKVPLDGFQSLMGMHGVQKFNIHRVGNPHLLPTAHTCFNQLDLSAFESEEQLRKSMYIAIREGSSGFMII